MIKSNIKEAISKWNEKNPTLRKKTLGSIADDLGISTSALSQIETSSQFQKHAAVIFDSNDRNKQIETFELYRKLDIPVIKKLARITDFLECDVCDLVKTTLN